MVYDKKSDEKDWNYLNRKAPRIYHALNNIKGLHDVCGNLFDSRTTYWEGNNRVDLTNKIIFGCLKIEIDELKDKFSDTEEKYRAAKDKEVEWHIFGKERQKVVFENGVGELAKIPLDVLDIITNVKSFDGEISSDGFYVKYVRSGETICRVPKSLVNKLSSERRIAPREGGGGG